MWKYLNKGISTPLAIIIILILVILVGGFTWWQYGEIRKEETNVPEVQIPEKENETAGWKTYTNERYGYSFTYPKEWQGYPTAETPQEAEEMKIFTFIDADKRLESVSSGSELITIVFKNNLTLDKWKKEIEQGTEKEYKVLKFEKITIDNRDGYELIIYYGNESKKLRAFYVFIKDRICGLSCSGSIDFYDKYCDTIINSFTVQ